jgi:hypothetical protein
MARSPVCGSPKRSRFCWRRSQSEENEFTDVSVATRQREERAGVAAPAANALRLRMFREFDLSGILSVVRYAASLMSGVMPADV